MPLLQIFCTAIVGGLGWMIKNIYEKKEKDIEDQKEFLKISQQNQQNIERNLEIIKQNYERSLENEHKVDALVASQKVLMRESLIAKHDIYVEKGFLTTEEFDDYEEMYKCYEALKGNGTGHKMYLEVCEIPIHNER